MNSCGFQDSTKEDGKETRRTKETELTRGVGSDDSSRLRFLLRVTENGNILEGENLYPV